MKKLTMLFVLAVITGTGLPVPAAEPLVDADWVGANASAPSIVMVDIREFKDFEEGHLPGAVSARHPGGRWRVRRGGLTGILPEVKNLESLIGGLGIDSASHAVVVWDGNTEAGLMAAAQVYWTFKYLGHDAVSILDGGMKAAAGKTVAVLKGRVTPQRKTFKAALRPRLLATQDDVKAALNGGIVVDYRASAYYLGINKRPSVARYGTIPGTVNLPYLWLTDDSGVRLQDRRSLARIFAYAGVPAVGPQISIGSAGLISALGWFAASEVLGNTEVRLYDAGLNEWAANPANPMQRTINPY